MKIFSPIDAANPAKPIKPLDFVDESMSQAHTSAKLKGQLLRS